MTRRIWKGALLLGLAAAVGSCVIIVQPPKPVPVPVPVALTCTNEQGAPTAHLIFEMRLERSTANLKANYVNIMMKTVGALTAAGILPTIAVLVRADERPVEKHGLLAAWGCQLDDPQKLTPEMVIEHYVVEDLPPSPIGCVEDPLIDIGKSMTDLTTDYPSSLPGRSGLSVFGSAPDLVLVVHFDQSARRTAYTDAACAGAHAMGETDDDENPTWLHYADRPVESGKVVHWFFTTDEAVDREHFVHGCKSYEGFPTSTLDVLEPSPNVVYGPLSDDLGDGGQTAVLFPLCAALTDKELNPFFFAEIPRIAAIAGTAPDLDALGAILGGMTPMEVTQAMGGGE